MATPRVPRVPEQPQSPLAPGAATPVNPGKSPVYTVKKGDTLSAIAKRYGVSFIQLVHANPQIRNPGKVYPGEPVTIPKARVIQEPYRGGAKIITKTSPYQDPKRNDVSA